MSDAHFIDVTDSGYSPNIGVVQSVAGVHSEAEGFSGGCRHSDHVEQTASVGFGPGFGVFASVDLDHSGTDLMGGLDLMLHGIDEQTHGDVLFPETGDDVAKLVALSGNIQSTLSGELLSFFRYQSHKVRLDVQCDTNDLIGCTHFQVQLGGDRLSERPYIFILDMAPVLAQMDDNAVRAGVFADRCCRDGVRFAAAAGIPEGRNVVDIDAQPHDRLGKITKFPSFIKESLWRDVTNLYTGRNAMTIFPGGSMYRSAQLFVLSMILVTVSAAQDIEDSIDRTASGVERFVDGVVDRIGSQVDRLNGRREESDDMVAVDPRQDTDLKSKSDAVTFNGNTEIALNDTVDGDLVVKNGTLVVIGMVNGDVLVVNGDIELRSSARVLGNVRAMNGSITKADGAFVEGFTEQSSNTGNRKSRMRSTYRTKYSYSFKPYYWNTENIFDDNFLFRYNRVEGLFLGVGSEKKFYWDGSKSLSGFGSFGYGFTSHKWRLQLGLDRQFSVSDETLLEMGAEAHSLTDTKDEWLMPLSENNLAAIFFREDFRDYFQREGFSGHAARYTRTEEMSTMVDIRFLNDRYASLVSGAQWGVFGGRTFRSNPGISTGTMKSVTVSAGLSTVERYRYRIEGWNLYAKGEYAGRTLGGDFNFTQVVLDLRRFQPLGDDDQINLRLRAGSLEGVSLPQKELELGGANTLPAYGYKEFVGNRMLLANLEYRLSGDVIDEIFFFPNSLSLIAFGDAGAVASVKTTWALHEGFNKLSGSAVRSDYGIAVGWHDGDARLGFAWRTDKQAPVSIFFRLNRSF